MNSFVTQKGKKVIDIYIYFRKQILIKLNIFLKSIFSIETIIGIIGLIKIYYFRKNNSKIG